MRRRIPALLSALLCSGLLSVVLFANPPSGAIFTTVADGSEVNFNIYPSKEAVYLDGFPSPTSRAAMSAGSPSMASGSRNPARRMSRCSFRRPPRR